MRLIGVMRLCDEFTDEIHLTIGSLAAACDQVCFLDDHVTNPQIVKAVAACNNLAGVRRYTEQPWNHYHSIDQAYAYADTFEPDWVVMQDQDELLPYPQLREGILRMNDAGADTLVLPVLHCWGSPDRIVWPRLNCTGNHAKVYRGRNPDFTICDGGGCCMPRQPFAPFFWPYCYRHLGFMNEACRALRLGVPTNRTRQEPWSVTAPPTFPYRPDWPIQRYEELTPDEQ